MSDGFDQFAELLERITMLENRLANTAIHGPVHEVDTKKQLARIRLGGDDDNPYLSPWVPYSQSAGAYKKHQPPSKGQNMTIFSPSGDPEQGMLLPFTWSDSNTSPSDSPDENVETFHEARRDFNKEFVRSKFKDGRFAAWADGIKMRFKEFWIVIDSNGIRSSHPITTGADPKPEL